MREHRTSWRPARALVARPAGDPQGSDADDRGVATHVKIRDQAHREQGDELEVPHAVPLGPLRG